MYISKYKQRDARKNHHKNKKLCEILSKKNQKG